ncbi:hypothetical protein GCM10023195_74910 [Actinoallomurus liliacearum]|uniref:Uncharacterized protein n=1 Tax=Actinoallomurus liliacearum TaxID=1080073 RepID=A0ABP8TUN6_9ACTN
MTRRDNEMSDDEALRTVVSNLAFSMVGPDKTKPGDVRRSYTDGDLDRAERRVFGEKPPSS